MKHILLECFHKVTHSYEASFLIKTDAETLIVPKIIFKIRPMLRWILFEILLMSANKDFCTETRLCNILKTTNTETLIKAILESP